MRKREKRNWNSEPQIFGVECESNMRVTRKLEKICQGLTLPAEQGEATRFLANTENAERVNDLVDEIYEGFMEYQVCMAIAHFLSCLTFV